MKDIEVDLEPAQEQDKPQAPEPASAADEGPIWPQGEDYDPRKDLGPSRPEDREQ